MGRSRKSRVLFVWMNGEHVGEWRRPASGPQEFAYAESWLSAAPARAISLSLPLRPPTQPYRKGVTEFFDNLLPDDRGIRERIQQRFRTASTAAFDLLQEIGRDCVGALQLLPEGHPRPNVRHITAEPLRARDVAQILTASLNPRFGGVDDDTFRISLAGVQEKTALLRHEGAWHRPTGATPTTHILKLPIGGNPQGIDLSTSVENEWLCAQIVKAYGIPVAPCDVQRFGEHKTLVVQRFDRLLSKDGAWYMRLPQEDFCQATATPSALKYESDGGQGIEQIMELLLGSERAAEDRRDFMRTQLVFWLLAAIDGHAKNFSIFLLPGSAYRLTPRYDILSAYPILGHGQSKLSPRKIRMAMAVSGKNRHCRWNEIAARHWLETARRCGFAEMRAVMEELVLQTPGVVQKVTQLLPAGFPAEIAEAVLDGTADAARLLGEQMARDSLALQAKKPSRA